MEIQKFQQHILTWHKKNRRDLPWRRTKDPYKILVSEIMLHQTQVSRVLEKYEEFLKVFPAIEDLANTSERKLLSTWKGLGYWKRALYLKETATILSGKPFPRDITALQKLPGIGPYTARAVACFAFQNTDAFIDTNIRRVYLHFFFHGKNNVSDKAIEKIAQQAVIDTNPREWHYALFDYGAEVLKDKSINKNSKHYQKQSQFKDSFRSFRSKAINTLLSCNNISKTALKKSLDKELKDSPYSSKEIIDSLLKDSLIQQSKNHYFL